MKVITILSILLFFPIISLVAQTPPIYGYEEDIVLGNIPTEFPIYPATDSIMSKSIVESGDSTIFQGGSVVKLEVGFHAKAGSNFVARIEMGNQAGYFLPNNPSYFDYARFYNVAADTSEGGFDAAIYKNSLIWEERLYPTGNASLAANGITQYAQAFNNGQLAACSSISSNWECIGPTGKPTGTKLGVGTGQIHLIYFSPQYMTDQTVYAASGWSGLWRRIGNSDWEVLNTDTQLPFTSVSSMVINPTNTDVIFITTGDAEFTLGHHAQNQNNATPTAFTPIFTAGVYRSMDGGTTWEAINGVNQSLLDDFVDGGTIRKINMNPNNSNQIFIATTAGVYKSDNALATTPTWTKLTEYDDFEMRAIEFRPDNAQTLFVSGIDIYKSVDGGTTWNSMTGQNTGLELDNLPNRSQGFRVSRINIATTASSNPNNTDKTKIYSYILMLKDGGNGATVSAYYIYAYDGQAWQQLRYRVEGNIATSLVNNAWSAIVAASDNENEMYFGTSILLGGNNTASSIIPLSTYFDEESHHPDLHALAFEPGTENLFVGTDGGVHIKNTLDQSNSDDSWTDISEGLQVSTPYAFDDTEGRTDRVMIGNQDTGTNVYEDGEWRIVNGGDGYNGKIDGVTGLGFGAQNNVGRNSSKGMFSYTFENNSNDVTKVEASSELRPEDPTEGGDVSFKGSYDMANHPLTERMYFTMGELYERIKSEQPSLGDTDADIWKLRSDIGKSDDIKAKWKRQLLNEFAISESNPDVIYLALSGVAVDLPNYVGGSVIVQPKLFKSTIGGCDGIADYNSKQCFFDVTDNLIASGITNDSYQLIFPNGEETIIPVITAVAIDPENENNVWISFTGYQADAKVWYTTDGGDTWSNADPNGSLNNLPVNDIVYQRGSNDRLYIATDAGIYYKDANMTDWERFCDFPNVRVVELKVNYCMGKIRAATFGRSVWQGDLLPTDGTLGNAALRIEANTVWDFSRGLDRNLRIVSGNKLTINNNAVLSMPKDGKILIEPGAELEITNATITNNCDETWGGIEVRGNPMLAQTSVNQGILRLTNATLTNARSAVSLDEGGFGAAGGGIVIADNCQFLNNRRSVEFAQYTSSTNQSRFDNCTFRLDDDFPFSGFIAHITMFDVSTIFIEDCIFENNNTNLIANERQQAIFALNASFQIDGTCTFSGFDEAVYSSNSGTNNSFRVGGATFTDNAVGIYMNDVDQVTIVSNQFTVGQRKTGAFNHGIYINESTAYEIENNTFTGVNNGVANFPVGVLCLNTGDDNNSIFKNSYSGLHIANHSEGDNRDNNNNLNGLQFLCNDHSNNTYDILIGIDDNEDELLSGARFFQGTSGESAGNTFSLNNSPQGSDYFNGSEWGINYYYDNGTNKQPLNVEQVSVLVTANTNNCNSIFNSSLAELKSDYATFEREYEILLNAYEAQLDNGDTDALLAQLTNAAPSAIEAQLLELAPWVSARVLQSVQSQLSANSLKTMLLANPDVLQSANLRRQLKLLFSDVAYDEVLEAGRTANTNRTVLARQLNEQLTTLQLTILQLINSDHVTDTEIEEWLKSKRSVAAYFAQIELALSKKEYGKVRQLLNSFDSQFSLNMTQLEALSDYRQLIQLIAKVKQSSRDLYALSNEEVATLVDLADNGKNKAQVQAREILNFFYDYDYRPEQRNILERRNLVEETNESRKLPSKWQAIDVYPNPASDQVLFSYDLSPYPEKKGVLQIHGKDGQVLQRFVLRDEKGSFEWNAAALEAGWYYYKLYLKESETVVHKLLIVK